jgi:hypothetical protein
MLPATFFPLNRAHVLLRSSTRLSHCGRSFERTQDWTRPFGQTQGMLVERSPIFQGCVLVPHGW